MHTKIRGFSIILILAACMLLFSSCGSKNSEPEVTTFRMKEDGTVTQTIIGEVDEETSASDLQSYISALVEDYTDGAEEPSVTLESVKKEEEDGKTRIVLSFSSIGDYAAFNRVDAFTGTVSEAYRNGYSFDKKFVTDTGIPVSGYMIPAEYRDLPVIVFKEAMNVILPEKALLVSDDITVNEDGSFTIAKSSVTSIPEVFQSVNSSCSYIILNHKES